MERASARRVSCFLEMWNMLPSFGSRWSPSLNREWGEKGEGEQRERTLDLAACKVLAQRKAWNYPYPKIPLSHKKSGGWMHGWERKTLGNKTSLKSFLLVTHDGLPSGLLLCILPVKPSWALWLGKLSLYYWFCEYFIQVFPRLFLSSQRLASPFHLDVMFLPSLWWPPLCSSLMSTTTTFFQRPCLLLGPPQHPKDVFAVEGCGEKMWEEDGKIAAKNANEQCRWRSWQELGYLFSSI